MKDNKTIGSVIQSLRKEKNITQRELAKAIHVTDKSVSRWETEVSYPDLDALYAISEFFNVPFEDLLELRINSSNADISINKSKFKYSYLIFGILVVIIIFLICLLVRNTSNNSKIYTIYGEDEYMYITNGFYIDSDDQDILVLGNIVFKEDIDYENIELQIITSESIYKFTRLDNIYLYLDELNIDDVSIKIIVDDELEYEIKLDYSENIVTNLEDEVVLSFEIGEYTQDDIIEMLLENGLEYVNEDKLSGSIEEYDIIYYKGLNVIQLNFRMDKLTYKLKYDFYDNVLNVFATYNSLNAVKDYSYYLKTDYLECNIGICEYSEIETTLNILDKVIFSKLG